MRTTHDKNGVEIDHALTMMCVFLFVLFVIRDHFTVCCAHQGGLGREKTVIERLGHFEMREVVEPSRTHLLGKLSRAAIGIDLYPECVLPTDTLGDVERASVLCG